MEINLMVPRFSRSSMKDNTDSVGASLTWWLYSLCKEAHLQSRITVHLQNTILWCFPLSHSSLKGDRCQRNISSWEPFPRSPYKRLSHINCINRKKRLSSQRPHCGCRILCSAFSEFQLCRALKVRRTEYTDMQYGMTGTENRPNCQLK